MLVKSAMAGDRRLTQPIGGGGIPTPVGAFQTNAQCSITIPAPPSGLRTHLMVVMCGYSAAGIVANALGGLPGLAAIAVNGITDGVLEIPNPFSTASYNITLAAGGVGVIGFLVAYFEYD